MIPENLLCGQETICIAHKLLPLLKQKLITIWELCSENLLLILKNSGKELLSSKGLDIVRNIMFKFGFVNIENNHACIQLFSLFF